ncbi:bifunctional [glutamine synthetase] adenylyltransferase/[glutamine synthetase]-adenylyl-L-tyrosine phosphorylase [Albimonas sp. CAU 1670]|uniref:bifunctional [glutamine synthetase] adenylyltransferase/[glutamine synthetase]-adenylyl-L-tyrosine phosphorylase n=1 Tax=Albimonas sp. CAU 1670 TaxID=3032599 RepID=UPI0023DAB422|nr:bifunctional [glutamine synthetase] adenylyltransferase/[glutamine synthetase]-adenylyl-L-tyrosine phosphorylase [Albimonas sp. CAU 1670]MDF2232656.1 bifunctional [glutamine synthetase] adenylyltransferase/[glutamine synthetase]-adenylyl-L-tyrosine phosphorylase [Albimonas sp. CAU 1670]
MTAQTPGSASAAPFAARLTRAPLAHDPARGRESWEALAAHLDAPELRPLVEGTGGSSPFLHGLISREAEWLADALEGPPEPALAALIADARAAAEADTGLRAGILRRGKRRLALLTGLADLGGVWDLDATTAALSDFADAAVEGALRGLLADELARGRLKLDPDDAAGMAGLFGLAMGKGGARELNYSSDIDLIFLFDESRHDPDAYAEARSRLVKVVQGVSQLLSKPTGEGYVFRVDLRLRPDPSVTPVCIGMETAERYYESLGRTWERAAFIKARASVGDIEAGEAFLNRLRPFVWRRFLDFAAIRDAHDIRERIRAHRGGGGAINVPGHNVKLGRGGIREIEFFVQTRQLICGGRDPALRDRGTRGALRALTQAGWVGEDAAAELDAAYVAHRELEHRLQMIEDRQTQTMPTAAEARDRVAALSGWTDRAAFEADILARLERVSKISEAFFQPPGAPPPEAREDAGDLASRGFQRPETAEGIIERWRQGAIPATRAPRARMLLAGLEPRILDALGAAASPDDALAQFDRFLTNLPAGVQVFSLFEQNPRLVDLLAEICAASPRLAEMLGRSSRVLDAILATDFFEPLGDADALTAELGEWLSREEDYERQLDAARAWAKEMRFRMGVQLLRGIADAEEAGQGFSAIAEAAIRALFPIVEAQFARRHGPPPGRGAAVLAMGRLGSGEMTATSDLDLILLYDAQGQESSEGPRPLSSPAWFARFTQALISAMTAKTAEGELYEIDMRLRPSGRQGTVATSLSGFRDYQAERAWTWERMALTRARPVAGRDDLQADVRAAVEEALRLPRPAAQTWVGAADMRARIAEADKGARRDPWAMKRHRGGLMEIEFVAQAGLLAAAGEGEADLPLGAASAPRALEALEARGRLEAGDVAVLRSAHDLQSRLLQALRVAASGAFDPAAAGPGPIAALLRVSEAPDIDALSARLEAEREAAAAVVDRLLPAPGDDAAGEGGG